MHDVNREATTRYHAKTLEAFAAAVLQKAGLPGQRAAVVAHTLVEADLMGHSTHGLSLLAPYLKELDSGGMTKEGMPELVRDTGAAITWDGRYLPGPWLMHQAIALAEERLGKHPVVTVVIRRSHHIACLATYPERLARQGMLVLLSCSDPANRTVAPYGGLDPVYSPNPIAAGIPTGDDPVIFDISTSVTANGTIMQKHYDGERLPYPWLMDSDGQLTDDPAAFINEPPATILPLGGMDTGYKGFALGLLVEALTNALAGAGRSEVVDVWSGSVFLQVINPEAFSGREYFIGEIRHLIRKCMGSRVAPGNDHIRLPGTRAFALREEQREKGVLLHHSIAPALRECARQYEVNMPDPVS